MSTTVQKSKTPPQPLMKRVVYPFALGIVVYLLSGSLLFVAGVLFAIKQSTPLSVGFTFLGGVAIYFMSFFVLGPLLTLVFAYQRSSLWRKDKRKIAALTAKRK